MSDLVSLPGLTPSALPMPDVGLLLQALRGEVAASEAAPAFVLGAAALAAVNRRLWDLEDTARRSRNTPAQAAETKARIDEANEERARLVQALDDSLARAMGTEAVAFEAEPAPGLLPTETPGQIIDRLSIAIIRAERAAAAGRAEAVAYARYLEAAWAGLMAEIAHRRQPFRARVPGKNYAAPPPEEPPRRIKLSKN